MQQEAERLDEIQKEVEAQMGTEGGTDFNVKKGEVPNC